MACVTVGVSFGGKNGETSSEVFDESCIPQVIIMDDELVELLKVTF